MNVAQGKFQRGLASSIKRARLRRGLRQKDFVKFGYSVRHYQKIESGKLNLTLKTLFKIANALNSDVVEFIRPYEDWTSIYRDFFFECPFGIIIWELKDHSDPNSLSLFEHNRYGAKAVHRDLANAKGKTMLEIFPKAKDQRVLQILNEVITTGESQFIPELVRHDEGFPMTVFSTRFVKCGESLGAAIFIDITEQFPRRQEPRLPVGKEAQIAALKIEVNQCLVELGRAPKYE